MSLEDIRSFLAEPCHGDWYEKLMTCLLRLVFSLVILICRRLALHLTKKADQLNDKMKIEENEATKYKQEELGPENIQDNSNNDCCVEQDDVDEDNSWLDYIDD